MPRLILLEWDDTELRVLDARSGVRESKVDRSFVVPLEFDGDEGPSMVVSDAIKRAGLSKADAIVSIGRAGCQLRTFHVPNAPDNELPDMVRFQAMREFPNLSQSSAVDFLRIGQDEEHGIEVLVAVLSDELLKQVTLTIERAGLNLKRVVLRPFATATHVIRYAGKPSGDASHSAFLVVDQSSDETDLTVVQGCRLITTRTVRIDANVSDAAAQGQARQTLIGEVNRTLVAAKNQGSRIENVSILLAGSETEFGTLRASLSDSFDSPVEVYNPFDISKLSNVEQPPHVGRFTSLLGALEQESGDSDLRIDFLNPRRKVEDQSGRKKLTFYGTLAGITLMVLLLVSYLPLHFKGKQIESMRQSLNVLEQADASNQEFNNEVKDLDEWADREVLLLDEMYYLSYHLPPADRVILNSMSFKYPRRTSSPTISITGRVKGSETVAEIEQSLRDDKGVHEASGKVVKPVAGDELYDHEFDETISLDKNGLQQRINKPRRAQAGGTVPSPEQANE